MIWSICRVNRLFGRLDISAGSPHNLTMDGSNQQFEYSKCHRNLINQRNLDAHQKLCGNDYKSRNNLCNKCDRYFATPKDLAEHLLTCGRFMCYQYNVPFIHPKALNYHIEHFHRRSPDKEKQYKCSYNYII